MAAPIVWALFAAANLAGGALLRQPEINRLKAQVRTLQVQIGKLQLIIAEQHRQIQELKLRYDTLKFFHIFEKQRVSMNIKEQIFQICAFKEYINLAITRSRGEKLSERPQNFLHTYEMISTGNDDKISDIDFDFMIEYIEEKYSGSIESFTAPSVDAELIALQQYS